MDRKARLLRVRDPKPSGNERNVANSTTVSHTTVRVKGVPRSACGKSIRASNRNFFSTADEVTTDFCDTRARYVSSYTNTGDVTFVTTKQFRLSVIDCSAKAGDTSPKPLDLSVDHLICNHDSAIDLSQPQEHSHKKKFINEPKEAFAVTSNSIPSPNKQVKPHRNLLSRVTRRNTECGLGTRNDDLNMLSSRRHHSEESYANREHSVSSGGKPTYPTAADSWSDTRSSPDHHNVNGFLDSSFEANENFEHNSDMSDQCEKAGEEDSVRDDSEHRILDAASMEDQGSPYNYSIQDQADNQDLRLSNSCLETSLMKAKRARVENIVTSIKDKPSRASSSDQINNPNESQNIDYEAQEIQRSRKRGTAAKIRELQKEIAFLQKECEYSVDDAFDPCQEDDGSSYECEDWSVPSKRARFGDVGDQENAKNKHGYYRGAIQVTLPKNGRNSGLPNGVNPAVVAYDVLVQSLKRELTSALVKVAEKSAKRVLAEFQPAASEQDGLVGNRPFTRPQMNDDVRDVTKDRKSNDNDVIALDATKKQFTSGFMVEGKMERMRTANQSQMCFGDVQVRRSVSAVGRGAETPPTPSIYSKFNFKPGEEENWGKSGSPSVETINSSASPSSTQKLEEEERGVQTQALSLVTRKSSSISPNAATSPLSQGDRPFVTLDRQRQVSPPSLSRPEQARNQAKVSPRLNRLPPASEMSPAPDRSPPGLLPQNKFFPHSLIPESSFYSPSVSSAFRHPLRHDPLTSSSFRRHDPFSAPSMMKPPTLPFAPSLYTSTAHPQVFPFTPGQLPFQLLPGFHQRTLANALADYGRLREGFEPTSSRPVSTRTSTRESSKPMGLLKNHHVSKSDSLDYRNVSPADVSPYSAASIQEGLTPQHLKKAKLMFFYTRYPSANTLKTYFNDVKFSRATTSQLIKWFSNFREFYYIQMEKFARQALSDGVAETNQLRVSRDSELFRVLNLHYNKSNDFRVPQEFIDATLKSLQEFFHAIQRGKDHDPSWKKVIYKIICKLDQDIPHLFKSPNVLDHLDEVSN